MSRHAAAAGATEAIAGARTLAGDLHEVWLVDLDRMAEPIEMLARSRRDLQLLPEADCPSALHRPAGAPARQDLARAVLRLILAHRLADKSGQPITAPDIRVRADGKPHLAGDEIAFSLSHSGSLALVAIADLGPLGVDLELPRVVAIEEARRLQIEAVAAALAPDDPLPGELEPRLLVAWTRLEAVAKATGEGVGRLMTRLGMTRSSAATRDPDPARHAVRWLAVSGLVVRDLPLGPKRHGAAAYPSRLGPPRVITDADAFAELISTTSAR